jgi:8,8a-deoxyoleandolide synthase
MTEPTAAQPTSVGDAVPSEGDAVAVVGIACRLPGAADRDRFWQLLRDGRDAVSEIPPERAAAWPSSETSSGVPRRAGLLPAADRFDADFFGVGPREAAALDPQQGLLLELAWEALEDAGILPHHQAGSATGVFVGANAGDHATLLHRQGPSALGRHSLTGTARGVLANRISYALDLRGPSLTVDAAQASSLVAVHLAVRSLTGGESGLALAGGVNLILAPESTQTVHRFGALSPDGYCYTFDARANGYVRGEGGAVLVLKPLARAEADGDRVYCVIRGSAVTHDGATDGLAMPAAAGQESAIRAALQRARVRPEQVQYVELHGTGTRAGDPVEAAALGAAIGTRESRPAPLAVGSVKTNIGHLEGAAGIAGLVKTALSIHHRALPPSLHFQTPNPAIALDRLGPRVATGADAAWPQPGQPLIAGVSSFGMGGTNCHVVLGPAPTGGRPEAGEAVLRGAVLQGAVAWPLSARTPAALRAQAQHLHGGPAARPADVAYSLVTTRTPFQHRAVVVGTGADELAAGLSALAAAEPHPGVVTGTARPSAEPGPVFVFPGQGSQWLGMGQELIDASGVFAESVAACHAALAPYTDWSLPDVLRGAPGAASLDRVEVVQPALFAMLVSLARVWEAAGVRPTAVIGHSQGEIAAAHVTGGLSLDDAARIVAIRSALLAGLSKRAGGGGMMSVPLPAHRVTELITAWPGRLSLAAVNGPSATVVSGAADALRELLARLTADGVDARAIPVDYASHSPQVETVEDDLLHALAGIAPRSSTIGYYSTVTATEHDTAALDAGYWYRNLRNAVRFDAAVRVAVAAGHRTFVEVSPHPVLSMGLRQIVDDAGVPGTVITGTLRRDDGGARRVLESLAHLHVAGVPVDWAAVHGPGRRVDLPTYPFQRRRWRTEPADEMPATASEPASEPAPELRDHDLLDLVRATAAVVLGHTGPAAVHPDRTFRDLGFDSVAAVEFRDRLAAAIGSALPATLTFDHPTPAAVAELLTPGAEPGGTRPGDRAEVGGRHDDPVVIVGVSGRWPGGADTLEELWRLVAEGRDAIGRFPADRGWDLDGLYDARAGEPGRSYVRHGGFLTDATTFDAEFFGIGAREAAAMDPQQRVLLETAWEALERTGINPGALRGRRFGVFVGAMPQDYGPRLHEPAAGHEGYLLTGALTSVLSGRVAYALGVEGPAVTVDTACSSSLVALHLAAQALRAGECEVALAGGVTVMATPGMFTEFSRQRGLAPDGRCKPFAAGADGTAWAEGAGVVVLERQSTAQRHGHQILAVVRGSAVNADGASNGLTAPNGPAQQRVIRQALTNAGLTTTDIDAVEAHGTGTTLGDPIEAQAIIATYGQRPTHQPLWLGSLKSNIGHTQAAAGAAGIIKSIAALREGVLPSTLHVDEPSPHVDWSAGTVQLLREARPWPAADRPRRIAVSSFGVSGTNAHVILEEPPAAGPQPEPAEGPTVAVPVSGHTPGALRDQAARISAVAATADPADLGYSLAAGRAALAERGVVVASDRAGLAAGLRAVAEDRPDPAVVRGTADTSGTVVFVFPGQGSQWAGMGRELLAASTQAPVFAARLEACERALAPHVDWSLRDVLLGAAGAPGLDRVDVVQPALWAVMVSLAELWRSHGVHPAAVVGHSQGEIAAATVAGALSLEDGARVVALRARAVLALSGRGAMASVALPVGEVERRIARWGTALSVATVNSPSAVVVAGDPAAVDEFVAECVAGEVRARRVAVDYASHSAHVEAVREEILSSLAGIRPRAGDVRLCSAVTAGWLDTSTMDAGYWYANLREPVRFADATRGLADAGYDVFVEVSPHPVLTPGITETVEGTGAARAAVTGTLRRDDGGLARFLTSLAEVYVRGGAVDWPAVYADARPRRVPLPTYPFQRRRYWLDAARSGATGGARPDGGLPALLPQPAAGPPLTERLAGLDRDERAGLLLDLVRTEAAAILGHPDVDEVATERAFRELGMDSLTAVALRNRLGAVTGLQLPATLMFDHPSPLAVSRFLDGRLSAGSTAPASARAAVEQLEAALAGDPDAPALAVRLRALLSALPEPGDSDLADDLDSDLDTASDDELFRLVDANTDTHWS